MTDVVKVTETFFTSVDEMARYTRGGGHYNMTTDNILLDYDGDELKAFILSVCRIWGYHIMAQPLSLMGFVTFVFEHRKQPMEYLTIFLIYMPSESL